MAELINLEINEISLVTDGDNKNADIAFFKRKAAMPSHLNKEEEMTDVTKANVDELAAKIEEIQSQLALLMEAITTDAQPMEDTPAEPAPMELAKSQDDDEVVELKKQLSDQTDIIMEFTKEATFRKFKKDADEFTKLPMDSDTMAGVLQAIDSLDIKDELLTMFKAVSAQLDLGDVTKTIGSDGSVSSDNASRLNSMAKARSDEKNISYAKAYTQVLTENPELYGDIK